jgi:signal transduction histidine kinase
MCCGLRLRLLLLVWLACAPLIALTVYQASEERRHAAQDWQQKAKTLAKTSADEEARLLRDTRQLLLSLATYTPIVNGNLGAASRFIQEELGRRPQYQNIGLVDLNGRLILSANPMGRADFSTAPFFRRTMASRDFSGDRFSARILGGGKATIDFGHPVYGTNGMNGVVFASVDLRWIDRSESKIRDLIHLRQGVWTEIDGSGKVAYRSPAPESFVGKPLGGKALLERALEAGGEMFTWEDQNGMAMAAAFVARESNMFENGLIGVLTIPRDILFKGANEQLWTNLLGVALAMCVTLFLGWMGSHLLVVKPIKTLVRASARLAAGDMSARTGLKHGHDELGQLTLAFDQMAEALEHREMERLKSARKLQSLSHKLVEVQENERRHIARELHDEIGQSLTAAEMNLQAALAAPRSANIERRLAASMKAVEQVLEQVHDLSLNLRPSMLDDLGLEPALRWLTRQQMELAGVEAEFHADHIERRLHPVIETECFRIAQEALTNIVRHARAGRAGVSLAAADGHLHLRVRDDGQGFDVAQLRGDAVRGASLGLLSMEERAALAGGGITLNSTLGRGTEVHAWFPLRWEGEQIPDEINDNSANLRAV